MNENAPEKKSGTGTTRRPFLVRFLAIFCSGLVAIFPVAAGLGVIFDPCRRRQSSAGGASNAASKGNVKPVRICPLDALIQGGPPQPFPVILEVVDDAWTRTFNQKVGVIFLERAKAGVKPEVVALSAKCPHLGCLVDFNPGKNQFQCPCHASAFAIDGAKLYGPSLRGMDRLDVEVTTGGQAEVYVAFQKFQPGIAERKPAG
jgi:menaquinol-cytochrome c reductase iron-sulfur subunit